MGVNPLATHFSKTDTASQILGSKNNLLSADQILETGSSNSFESK